LSVRTTYEAELAQRGYTTDPAQQRAIAALERCALEWTNYKQKRSNALKKMFVHPEIPRGVYMFGGVGRGKSFLMDCFFNAVPIRRKTRLHFHEFMREVHRELRELQGTVNPLDALGERIAQRYKLICFDEFHVADVTDAMILHRLLDALFKAGGSSRSWRSSMSTTAPTTASARSPTSSSTTARWARRPMPPWPGPSVNWPRRTTRIR